METLFACCIGFLTACGVFLMLRGRTFPVVLGLTMLSYAVNLFIFITGRLSVNKPPLIVQGEVIDPSLYADPLPQALVLTAIVIGFATTALYLVVLLGSRGLTGTDHVDGKERDSEE